MKGIDIPIQTTVDIFNTYLWVGNNNSFNGRCFVNEKKGIDIPEVYIGRKGYKEVLLDDRKASISFFDVNSEREQFNADVDIYFAVNMDKVYPSIGLRATEYIISDVLKVLEDSPFVLNKIITGKDAYTKWNDKYTNNMQPYFLLKLECSTEYSSC